MRTYAIIQIIILALTAFIMTFTLFVPWVISNPILPFWLDIVVLGVTALTWINGFILLGNLYLKRKK